MKNFIIYFCIFFFFPSIVFSQEIQKTGYIFTPVKTLKTTPVKNQYKSGTCWSYAATSFIETELLRMGKGEFDLSEIYFVRNAYIEKAIDYIRYHGTSNFGQGGQAHDVINIARKYGFTPESAYKGIEYQESGHIHMELEEVLKAFLNAIKENPNKKLSTVWLKAYTNIIDAYLGTIPNNFKFNNKDVTPIEFQKELQFNPDDYIEITSYAHHPFYSSFILEIPDNWSKGLYFNVPINELIQIIDNAINNGYSVVWDGDVSDKGFSHSNGVAIIPEKKLEDMNNTERSKWEKLSDSERNKMLYKFDEPQSEKVITQDDRQIVFDNYTVTDDHLMHFTGIVKDQNNTKYYVTKNSWDSTSNKFGGYLNISESFAKLNTVAIMIHKDALSKEMKSKLGIK